MQVLVNDKVYYLVDRRDPLDFLGMQPIKAVVVHSPDSIPKALNNFMKQHRGVDSAKWYMPPLEEEEVLQMLPAFPSVTEETVRTILPVNVLPVCVLYDT